MWPQVKSVGGRGGPPASGCSHTFVAIFRQEFPRDATMQPNVRGLVNHTHPTAAKAFHSAIVREGLFKQRIVAGHVLHICGCAKSQVNEEEVFACG